jgi:hypothetical protein
VQIRHQRDGTVAIGPQRELSNLKPEDKIEKIRETTFVDATNEELFAAVLVCKHNDVILDPITLINATDAQVEDAMFRYPNAPIVDNGDGTHTIV